MGSYLKSEGNDLHFDSQLLTVCSFTNEQVNFHNFTYRVQAFSKSRPSQFMIFEVKIVPKSNPSRTFKSSFISLPRVASAYFSHGTVRVNEGRYIPVCKCRFYLECFFFLNRFTGSTYSLAIRPLSSVQYLELLLS